MGRCCPLACLGPATRGAEGCRWVTQGLPSSRRGQLRLPVGVDAFWAGEGEVTEGVSFSHGIVLESESGRAGLFLYQAAFGAGPGSLGVGQGSAVFGVPGWSPFFRRKMNQDWGWAGGPGAWFQHLGTRSLPTELRPPPFPGSLCSGVPCIPTLLS